MIKKVLLSITILVTMFTLISASVFAQAQPNYEQDGVKSDEQAAIFLKAKGLLQGNEHGDLMLKNELTREQMIVIISRLMGQEDEARSYSTSKLKFTDVPKTSEYANYIAWAKDNGITQGYGPTMFGFGDKLTRWQVQAFIVRVLGYTDTSDDMVTMAFYDYLTGNDPDANGALSFEAFIMNDEKSPIIREHVATFMYFSLYAETKDGGLLGEKLGVLN